MVLPRLEDRRDRARELRLRVAREVLPGLFLHDRFEGGDELLQLLGGELGVRHLPLELFGVHTGRIDPLRLRRVGADLIERRLEPRLLHPERDVRVHRDEAPVGVVGEARVLRPPREPLRRRVVQAQVQDRVHHPRHRGARPRTHAHEERVRRIAKRHPDALLDPSERREDVLLGLGRELPVLDERRALFGRDREPRGDGKSEARHLGEPGPFSAEEVTPLGIALFRLLAVTEKEHVGCHDAGL